MLTRLSCKIWCLAPPLLLASVAHAAPILTEVTPIRPKIHDTTPSYTFNSTEAGTISYGGACSSSQTAAVVGNNTVTFNTLALGAC